MKFKRLLFSLLILILSGVGGLHCSSNKQTPSEQIQSGPISGQGILTTAEGSSKTCSSDADCVGGQICLVNLKQCVSPPPGGCNFGQDCPVGKVCNQNTQHCAESDCGGSNPTKCPLGQVCITDQDCVAGDQCTNGICSLPSSPKSCVGGCPSGQQCNNGQCVTVSAPTTPTCPLTQPLNGSDKWGTGFSGSSALAVTFSEPMDKSTINENTFILEKGIAHCNDNSGCPSSSLCVSGACAPKCKEQWDCSWNSHCLYVSSTEAACVQNISGKVKGGVVLIGNDNVALFAQYDDLEANTHYRATITTGAKSKLGVPLAQACQWNFTTANAVTSVTPKDGNDQLNTTFPDVSVQFEAPVDPNDFSEDSIVIDPPVAIKEVHQDPTLGTVFMLGQELKDKTTYTATLKKGNVLAGDYNWKFSTGVQQTTNFSVNFCNGKKIPMIFSIDCSHLKAGDRNTCEAFIENVACRAFPAYEKITQINLEKRCPQLTYTIYTSQNWPHKNKPFGGLSQDCKADYIDENSVNQQWFELPSGPYDAHEILHHFQMSMGLENTYEHPLFASSMAEAMKLIGDKPGFQNAIQGMENDITNFINHPEKVGGKCKIAQAVVEEGLYLKNNNIIYEIYSDLLNGNPQVPIPPSGTDSTIWDETFISKALYKVSGNENKVKSYLIQNGCAAF